MIYTHQDFKAIVALNSKFVRKELNLTQQQLAELVNTKRANIGAIEEQRALSLEIINQIAFLYDVSLDVFLKENLNDYKFFCEKRKPGVETRL
jgi:transcriptional regulator with XRE-family HTH domain